MPPIISGGDEEALSGRIMLNNINASYGIIRYRYTQTQGERQWQLTRTREK